MVTHKCSAAGKWVCDRNKKGQENREFGTDNPSGETVQPWGLAAKRRHEKHCRKFGGIPLCW